MENLAIYDENGKQTGEYIERKQAHKEGILHGASHTYIYRIKNGRIQILLQRRSHNKDSFPGCLDISSAGHVEYGMDFIATAQKELKEELGIEAQRTEFTEAFKQRFSATNEFYGEVFHNEEINTIYTLERDIDIETLVLQPEEVEEVVWMDIEDIKMGIKSKDKEFCLDANEFEKVEESIKRKVNEMEESEKTEYTKKLYDAMIISGRFSSSPLVNRMLYKKDDHGEAILPRVRLEGMIANQLAERGRGIDSAVAEAIVYGVGLSNPTFNNDGRKFLNSVLPQFKRSDLGVALTKIILNGVGSERIPLILSGIEHVQEETKEISELTKEEKCALGAIKINDLAGRLNNKKDTIEFRDIMLDEAFGNLYENGTFRFPNIYTENLDLEDRRKTVENGEAGTRLLRQQFDYYMNHFEEIDQEFVEGLEGYSKEEIVAFYVCSRGESEVEREIKSNTRGDK